jgi:SAM-dependent methyltransferase
MPWGAETYRDPESVLRAFVSAHMEELAHAEEFLQPAERAELLAYYRGYVDRPLAGDRLEEFARGGARSTYHHALSRLLEARRAGRALKVLDAGCGLGTECILFALCGGDVTGIDLREERLRIAPKRARFYEQKLSTPLRVRFLLSNIFDLPERSAYDLVWVHNAISHIHPVDGFLRFSRDLLAPGGELVIVDVNKMSWRKRLQGEHEHGESLYTTRKDPNTGADVVYAVERDLTLPEQCELLAHNGFAVASHECLVGYHARAGRWLYEKILRPINRSMLLSSRLGSRYIVVGRKLP